MFSCVILLFLYAFLLTLYTFILEIVLWVYWFCCAGSFSYDARWLHDGSADGDDAATDGDDGSADGYDAAAADGNDVSCFYVPATSLHDDVWWRFSYGTGRSSRWFFHA
jgi:hypothetical protein